MDATGETAEQETASPVAEPEVSALDLGFLDVLDGRTLAEQAEIYHDLHVQLQRTLAEIDGG